VTSRAVRFLIASALMLISANYFLKYLWWSAFYSGSSGLGSHSKQVQNAAVRSTSYFWILVVLQLTAFVVVWSAMKLRRNNSSGLLWQALRLVASLTFTLMGTGLLTLLLAWIQTGAR
jgi:hypothetical protein